MSAVSPSGRGARLSTRLVGSLVVVLGALLIVGLLLGASRARADVEREERTRIAVLVDTLAPLIDGTLHEELSRRLDTPDEITDWERAPEDVRRLQALLVRAHEDNRLSTPIYTLRVRDGFLERIRADPERPLEDATEFVLTSSPVPYWKHRFDWLPQMAPALLEGRPSTSGIYSDANGTWISAYAPIRDRSGNVVALLEADAPLDRLLTGAWQRLEGLAIVGAVFFALATLAVWITCRTLTRDLTGLQESAETFGAGDYATSIHTTSNVRELVGLATSMELARRRIAEALEQREALNRDLDRAREEAEAAVVAKSQFMATMSHEIRTPMNGVLGMLDLLRDARLSPEELELVTTAHRSARHLLEILNDVLDFSMIDTGRLRVEFEPVDLRETVRDVCSLFQQQAGERGIVLRAHVAGDVPERVVTDPARLRQVLVNLVGNAVKFTERGRVGVEVTLTRATEAEVGVRFEVRDTGIGIAADDLLHLFQPFTQLDRSMQRRFGGTGLGLALSRRLVSLLGGVIRASSEPGRGSVFTVELPCTLARPAESEHPEPAAPLPRGAGGQEPLVLVVEDNPVNARIAVMMARRLGYRVLTVENGRQAVETFERARVDAILMDCQMPVMDGYEATRRIRALEHGQGHVPIIAITAHATQADRERALEAGMDDYLPKPVEREVLARALAEACRQAGRGPQLGRSAPVGRTPAPDPGEPLHRRGRDEPA